MKDEGNERCGADTAQFRLKPPKNDYTSEELMHVYRDASALMLKKEGRVLAVCPRKSGANVANGEGWRLFASWQSRSGGAVVRGVLLYWEGGW
jgi:hypothetical protein